MRKIILTLILIISPVLFLIDFAAVKFAGEKITFMQLCENYKISIINLITLICQK